MQILVQLVGLGYSAAIRCDGQRVPKFFSWDTWNHITVVHRVLGIVLKSGGTSRMGNARKPLIKGFSFEDDRHMNGNWLKEPNSDVILMFFRILALCHTAIPEPNEESRSFNYESESPDEGAFLVAAREFGFEFCKRTQSSLFIRERYPSPEQPIERSEYE
ncbi:hypothetical protein AAC387_Pa12g2102 [Persea americana]